jgi:hypothetical protein
MAPLLLRSPVGYPARFRRIRVALANWFWEHFTARDLDPDLAL